MKKIVFVLVMCAFVIAAQAVVVTNNAGFESPATATTQVVSSAGLGWTTLQVAGSVDSTMGVIASGYNGAPLAQEGAQYGYASVPNGPTAADVLSLQQTLDNSVIGMTYSLDFLYAHAGSSTASRNAVAVTVFIDGVARLFAQSDITTAQNTWAMGTSAAGAAAFPASYVAEYTATTEAPIYVYLKFTNRKAVECTTYVDAVNLYAVPEPATMALIGLGGLFLRRRSA